VEVAVRLNVIMVIQAQVVLVEVAVCADLVGSLQVVQLEPWVKVIVAAVLMVLIMVIILLAVAVELEVLVNRLQTVQLLGLVVWVYQIVYRGYQLPMP
jgi:hypothetical protein